MHIYCSDDLQHMYIQGSDYDLDHQLTLAKANEILCEGSGNAYAIADQTLARLL